MPSALSFSFHYNVIDCLCVNHLNPKMCHEISFTFDPVKLVKYKGNLLKEIWRLFISVHWLLCAEMKVESVLLVTVCVFACACLYALKFEELMTFSEILSPCSLLFKVWYYCNMLVIFTKYEVIKMGNGVHFFCFILP